MYETDAAQSNMKDYQTKMTEAGVRGRSSSRRSSAFSHCQNMKMHDEGGLYRPLSTGTGAFGFWDHDSDI